jgi:glycosyltransferase involved in cell wall biosynthesis
MNDGQKRKIYVDHTHLGRRVTGLERITEELFAPDSLAPLKLTPIRSSGTADLIWRQNLTLPSLLAFNRKAIALCPGFPPSLPLARFGSRVLPYIHDLFLITRKSDLNRRARHYMAPAFAHAVKRLPRFLVNSQYTAGELRKFCREDAEIMLYRPAVRNIFGLNDKARHESSAKEDMKKELRLIALGTIEPRKNLLAAADLVNALRARGYEGARLDIVGRFGWGREIDKLQKNMAVTLHGYQPVEKIRELMSRADLFINTSHDEGLGLPLLEAQYAGLPVIAPRAEVFREVLADSGLLIDVDEPGESAELIASMLEKEGWRRRHSRLARENLARWNAQASNDRSQLASRLEELTGPGRADIWNL